MGFIPTKKRIAKKNAVTFDVEKYAHLMWGVNVMPIIGMSNGGIITFIGELGHGFTEKLDT